MTSLYLFDHGFKLLEIIPEKELLRVRQLEELQEDDLPIDRLTVEYNLTAFKDVAAAHYMAVKDMENPNQFHLYYVTQPITTEHTAILEGKQLGHKELKHFIVQEIHPQNRQANFMMNQVLAGTDWRVGYVDSTPELSQHFYYLPALECLKVISSLFELELVFKVEISGQEITDKWVEAYNRRGTKTMKRFTHGSNILTIKGTMERSEIYTALIGRGRGEETETGGFGRRITFADVEWSVAKGDPVDKPLGQNYVEIPSATAEHGVNMLDGSKVPALGVFEDEEIEDEEQLLRATYDELVARIRPLILYQTTVADIGKVELGEVVGLHRYDLNVHYETRIKKLERDYLNPERTPVELGDRVYEGAKEREIRLQRTIRAISAVRREVREEINYVLETADGKNVVNYGNIEPSRKRVGDLWFRDHPTKPGHRQMLIWNGNAWEIELDTSLMEEMSNAIEEAKDIAETARDNTHRLMLDADSILAGLGIEGLSETNQNIVNQIKANVGDRIDDLLETKVSEDSIQYQSLVERYDLYERVIGSTEEGVETNVSRIVQSSNIIQTEVNSILDGNPSSLISDKQLRTISVHGPISYAVQGGQVNGVEYHLEFSIPSTSADGARVRIVDALNAGPNSNFKIADGRRHFRTQYTYDGSGSRPPNHPLRLVLENGTPDRIDDFRIEGLYRVSDMTGLRSTVTQLAGNWVLGIKNSTDLVASINASPSGVRIFGRNIVLDGDTTVVGSFTVTDTIFASNMSISKFTTGTLNAANVNLINVNVNSLVGNTSSFVQSAWNSISSSLTINGVGLTIQTSNSWDLRLVNHGIRVTGRDGNETGMFTALVDQTTREPRSLGVVAENGYDVILGYRGSNSSSGTTWSAAIRIDGTSGDIRMQNDLYISNNLIRTSVPTIYPNWTSNDSFYWNSLSAGGVTIRNSNNNNAGFNLRNDGFISLEGRLVPGTIYDTTGRSSGLEIVRGTVSGNGGYHWRHSNSNNASIFFADNGYVYIRSTSGNFSLVNPNFGN